MAATGAGAVASSANGLTSATFNGKDVSAYLKQSWGAVLEQANNPKVNNADKPEHYKAPSAPAGGAWGANTSAWANRPDPRKEQQMADGQPFLAGLSKAIDARKRAEKKQ